MSPPQSHAPVKRVQLLPPNPDGDLRYNHFLNGKGDPLRRAMYASVVSAPGLRFKGEDAAFVGIVCNAVRGCRHACDNCMFSRRLDGWLTSQANRTLCTQVEVEIAAEAKVTYLEEARLKQLATAKATEEGLAAEGKVVVWVVWEPVRLLLNKFYPAYLGTRRGDQLPLWRHPDGATVVSFCLLITAAA